MTSISCVSDEEAKSPVIKCNLLSETFKLNKLVWANEDIDIC